MIAKNLRRFKGTSSFRNASDHGLRNKSLHKQLLARKPDQGNYDPLDAYQKNLADVKMKRQSKRKSSITGQCGGYEAFNNLQDGDYSSFKNKEKTVNFGSIVPRDEVSFYNEIAVLKAANQHGLTVEKYTRMKQEHKSGKCEHTIFMKK